MPIRGADHSFSPVAAEYEASSSGLEAITWVGPFKALYVTGVE
jgi:hypothetical protein